MPVRFNPAVTAPGKLYGRPFVGPVNHTAQIAVNITVLTATEVDSQGFLIPGVPLSAAGALIGAATAVFGVVPEPLDVLHITAYSTLTWAAALAAAGTQQLAVGIIGAVNRKIIEDNRGVVLTANEIAGFATAPCTIKLLA